MKFSNGNTLMSDATFNTSVKSIRGRFDAYQSAAEFAVFHYAKHGNLAPLQRLANAFIGASGKIIGDGREVVAYVNRYTYGFTIEANGNVKTDKNKSGRRKPSGFKAFNDNGDLSAKAGAVDAGMAETFAQFKKKQAEHKAEKQAAKQAAEESLEVAKAEAKQAKAEANGETKAEAESTAPDYSRATALAMALRDMQSAVAASDSADVEALAEAKAEADKLADIIAKKLADITAQDEAATLPEVETETVADQA